MTDTTRRSSIYLRAFGIALLIVLIATVINLYGIRLLGGIEQWEQWRAETYWYFFVWRLLVYAALVRGWIWMRRRVLQREPDAGPRLRRIELLCLATVLLVEITRGLPHLS